MNNIYIYSIYIYIFHPHIYISQIEWHINSSPWLFEDHQEWMGTLHRCAVKSGEIGTSPDQKLPLLVIN